MRPQNQSSPAATGAAANLLFFFFFCPSDITYSGVTRYTNRGENGALGPRLPEQGQINIPSVAHCAHYPLSACAYCSE